MWTNRMKRAVAFLMSAAMLFSTNGMSALAEEIGEINQEAVEAAEDTLPAAEPEAPVETAPVESAEPTDTQDPENVLPSETAAAETQKVSEKTESESEETETTEEDRKEIKKRVTVVGDSAPQPTLKLLANNETVNNPELTVADTIVKTSDENNGTVKVYEYTFKNLPEKDTDDQPVNYTVMVDPMESFALSYQDEAGNFVCPDTWDNREISDNKAYYYIQYGDIGGPIVNDTDPKVSVNIQTVLPDNYVGNYYLPNNAEISDEGRRWHAEHVLLYEPGGSKTAVRAVPGEGQENVDAAYLNPEGSEKERAVNGDTIRLTNKEAEKPEEAKYGFTVRIDDDHFPESLSFQILVKGAPYTGSFKVNDTQYKAAEDGTVVVPVNYEKSFFVELDEVEPDEETETEEPISFTVACIDQGELHNQTAESQVGAAEQSPEFVFDAMYGTKQTVKQWNDRSSSERISPEDFKDQFHVTFSTDGGESYQVLDESTMDELGLDAMPDYTLNTTGSSTWTFTYDHLPLYTDKTQGKPVRYAAYESYEDDQYTSKLDGDETNDMKHDMVTNTKTMSYDADKVWADAGDDSKRPSVDDWKNGMVGLYRYTVNNQNDPEEVTALFSDLITVQDEGMKADDETVWHIHMDKLPAYDAMGYEYVYLIKETDAALKSADGEDYYTAEYTNVNEYASRDNGLYEGGELLNVLTNEKQVDITKIWADGNNQKRPEAKLYLYRFALGVGDYDTASPVSGFDNMAVINDASGDNETPLLHTFGEEGSLLPKYDATGHKYIYFASERCTGGDSTDYVKVVENSAGAEETSDIAGWKDSYVLDGGTIKNIKKNDVTISATKKFSAVFLQEILNNHTSVTLKLQRKSLNSDSEEAGFTDVYDEDEQPVTMTMDGFRAEAASQTKDFEGKYPLYDEKGYKYEYRYIETECQVGGVTVSVNEDNYQNDAEGEYLVQRELIQGIEYTDGTAVYLEVIKNADGSMTNRLNGVMDLHVTKEWDIRDKDGNIIHEPAEGTKIKVAVTQNGKPYTEIEVTTEDEWDKVLKELPRYDESGREYSYGVTETVIAPDGRTYKQILTEDTTYVNEELEGGTGLVKQLNAHFRNISGGDGPRLYFDLTKTWYDDSDAAHRYPVYAEVIDKETGKTVAVLDHTSNKEVTAIELSEARNWFASVEWTPEQKADGEYKTIDDYTVREIRVGENAVKYNQSPADDPVDADSTVISEISTPAGEVSTDQYDYHVYINKAAKNKDEAVYYLSNQRVGELTLSMNKTWKDAELMKYQKEHPSVKFRVDRYPADDPSAVEEVGTYELDSEWKWDDKFEKYDWKGRLYHYEITEIEVGGSQVADGRATVTIEAEGSQKKFVYKVEEKELDPEYGAHHTGDVYKWALKNTLVGSSEPIELYKVWYDAGTTKYKADGISERPDISFNMFRTAELTPEQVQALTSVTPGQNGIEAVSTDRIWNTVHNDWCWSCEIGSFPLYDADGKMYTYFITENVKSNKESRYQTYYVNDEYGRPNTAAAAHDYDVLDAEKSKLNRHVEVVLHGEDNFARTTINSREGVRILTGTKVWLNIPSSFAKADLPDVKMELRRTTDETLDWSQWETVSKETVSSTNDTTKFIFHDIYDLNHDGMTTDIAFDKYDSYGNLYTYEMKEVSEIDGYVTGNDASAALVLNNRYTGSDHVKITVGKLWENADSKEKAAVVYNLLRVLTDAQGNPIKNTEELAATVKKPETSDDNYTVTFEKDAQGSALRYYAPNGRPYKYYVAEVVPYGYEGKANGGSVQGSGKAVAKTDYLPLTEGSEHDYVYSGKTEGDQADFTNSYNGEKTEITVTKNWDDKDDRFGERPDDIVYILHRKLDGKEDTAFSRYSTKNKWEKNGNRWTYTYSELEKYAENGHAYTYYVEEKDDADSKYSIEGYKQSVKTDQAITNQLITKQIEVSKNWLSTGASTENLKQMSDEQLQILIDLGAFPAELTFKVEYSDDDGSTWTELKDKDGKVFQETASLKMDSAAAVRAVLNGGPLVKFEVPAYKPNSTTAFRQYRIVEETPKSGAFENDKPGKVDEGTGKKTAVVENTIRMKAVRVDKIWKDNTNRDNTRPSDLTVTVTRNDGRTIRFSHKSSVYPMPTADEQQTQALNALEAIGSTDLAESNRYNIWSSGIIYLPAVTDVSKTKATYTAAESSVDGYRSIDIAQQESEDVDFWFVFANEYIDKTRKTTDISANKIFEGDSKIDHMTRPETIYLKLQVQTWNKDKNAYDGWKDAANENCGLTGSAVHPVTASDQWQTTWDGVWQYAEQNTAVAQPLKYRVVETDQNGRQLNDNAPFAYKINNGRTINGNRKAVQDKTDITIKNTLKTTTTSVTKQFNAKDKDGHPINLIKDQIALMISQGVLPERLTFELYVSSDGGTNWKQFVDDENKPIQTVKEVTAANFANVTQSFTFTYPLKGEQVLPVYDKDGNKLTYKMEETAVRYKGDSSDRAVNDGKASGADLAETFTWSKGKVSGDTKITNTLSVGSVSVQKNWLDENNRDDKRALSVQLYRDGVPYGSSVKMTAAGGWKYTWTNLPVYQNGSDTAKSSYYVVETAESSYVTVNYADGNNKSVDPTEVTVNADPSNTDPAGTTLMINITNKHVPERFTIEADKTWKDALNVYGIRPDAVTFTLQYYDDAAKTWKDVTGGVTLDENGLYTDGTTVYSTDPAAQELTGSGTDEKWQKAVWTNLPVYYTVNGKKTKVKYRVVEADIKGYEHDIKSSQITGAQGKTKTANLTNTLERTDTSFKKVFRAVNDQNQVQQTRITDLRHINAKDLPDQIIFGIFYQTADDSEWTRLEFNGKQDLSIEQAAAGYISWNGNELIATLSSDTALDKLEAGIRIDKLPKYDREGNERHYKVEEIAVMYDNNRVDVSNGKAGSMNAFYDTDKNINEIYVGSIKMTKQWHDEADRDGERGTKTFILKRDGAQYGEPVTVSAADHWTYTWTDLPVYKPGSTDKSTYEIVEDPSSLGRYELEKVTITANGKKAEGAVTLDEANTAFTFTNKKLPDRTMIQASKSWDDYDNKFNLRPDDQKVTFTLQYQDGNEWKDVTVISKDDLKDGFYKDGETVYTTSKLSQTVTGKREDLAKWENLPVNRIVNGKSEKVVYQVFETDVPGYRQAHTTATDSDGHTAFAFTNTLIKKEITITKAWSLGERQKDNTTAHITITGSDGENYHQTYEHVFDLSQTSGGKQTYALTLPAYTKEGKEITYTVEEDEIAGAEKNKSGDFIVYGETKKDRDGKDHREILGRWDVDIQSTPDKSKDQTVDKKESHDITNKWVPAKDDSVGEIMINLQKLDPNGQLIKDIAKAKYQNAVFEITAPNGKKTSVQAVDGELKFDKLTVEGIYTIEEISAPQTYLKAKGTWSFKIERNMDDLEYTSLEKDEKAKELINYYGIHITEITGQKPWTWEPDAHAISGTLKVTDEKIVIPKGSGIQLEKRASDGTKQKLTDAEFKIYPYDAESGTYNMDEPISMSCVNGLYTNDQDLVPDTSNLGKYKIVETKAPDGYAGRWEQEITAGDHEGEQLTWNFTGKDAVYNDPNSFVLTKVNEDGKKLRSVSFNIWTGEQDASKAADVKNYKTDEKGQIKLTHLKNNTIYYYQEAKALFGYEKDETIYSFKVDENGFIEGKKDGQATVVNKKVPIYPDTGVNMGSNMPIILLLAMMFAAVVISLLFKKKKRDE